MRLATNHDQDGVVPVSISLTDAPLPMPGHPSDASDIGHRTSDRLMLAPDRFWTTHPLHFVHGSLTCAEQVSCSFYPSFGSDGAPPAASRLPFATLIGPPIARIIGPG
jgi:hypothetical protein